MKTVASASSKLLVASVHDLPLFAAYGHLAETEPKMPSDNFSINSVPDVETPRLGDVGSDDRPALLAAGTTHEAEHGGLSAPSVSQCAAGIGEACPADPAMIAPLTTGAIKAAIASWTDLDIRIRRNWASSVTRAERIIYAVEAERPPPDGVDRWSCAYLNEVLWAKPAAHIGIEESTHDTTVSDIRQILIRLGRHADAEPRRNVLSPAWAKLHAALPTVDRQRGLVRFMRFLTLEGIEPDAVTPDLIDCFDIWIRTRMLAENVISVTRKTASGWNWARANVPGWPQVELVRPDMRDQYTRPIEVMPASFQADVARFLEGLKGGNRRNPYRDPATIQHASGDARATAAGRVRRGRAVSRETVRYRLQQIRCAVAALLDAGVKLESITALRELVSPPERPRAILQHHIC